MYMMYGGWFEMSFRHLHSVIWIVSPENCALSQNCEILGNIFQTLLKRKKVIATSVSRPWVLLIVKCVIFSFCNSPTKVQNTSAKFCVGQIKLVNWLKISEGRLRYLILPRVLISSKIRVTWPAQTFNYLLQSDSVINKTDYPPHPAL